MSTSERLQLLLGEFKKEQLAAIEARAEAGDREAQFDLGALYANGHGVKADPTQAVAWLRKAAEQDQIAAHTLLGWFYANGHGVERNDSEAMQHYLTAAEAGDSDAQCALGEFYETGRQGVEANAEAMLNWYEAAARANHPKAQFALGRILSAGALVPQNDEAAFHWLTLAIANDSEPAQRELAMLTARLTGEEIERYKQRMLQNLNTRH